MKSAPPRAILVGMSHVLVAGHERGLLARISRHLIDRGHTTVEATDLGTAMATIERDVFAVIIVEAGLGGGQAPALIEAISRCSPTSQLLVISDPQEADGSVEAIQAGAFSVVQKPVLIEELGLKVGQAVDLRRLQHEAQSLRGERELVYRTEDIIGESQAIRTVLETVRRVARTSSNVILTGETGTGKELIAGAIHYNSDRAKGPFVRVNCAALPEQLLELELFGRDQEAAAEARKPRVGRLEQADGGTIFLDEIGAMSAAVQAMLLRVLQEREFARLGSGRTVRVDVRVLSATSRDLAGLIAAGGFRGDLYDLLNGAAIRVPPLRERRADILPLAGFFMRKLSGDLKRRPPEIVVQAARALEEYGWPGNVRQLRNVIELAVIVSDGAPITPGVLQLSAPDGLNLEEAERWLLIRALELCGWVQKDAARHLGLSSRAINYRIGKFGITHPNWKRNR